MATNKKKKIKTNPNGANQYLLDPRQKTCWDFYINPTSATFGNAYRSAIKAGYAHNTAINITKEKWFLEKTLRMNLLGKAEKVLNDMLTMPVKVRRINRSIKPLSLEDEEDEEAMEDVEYLETEPALVKIKQDTAKFIAERRGKDEGYSTRTELTDADGKSLFHPTAEETVSVDNAVDEVIANSKNEK